MDYEELIKDLPTSVWAPQLCWFLISKRGSIEIELGEKVGGFRSRMRSWGDERLGESEKPQHDGAWKLFRICDEFGVVEYGVTIGALQFNPPGGGKGVGVRTRGRLQVRGTAQAGQASPDVEGTSLEARMDEVARLYLGQ